MRENGGKSRGKLFSPLRRKSLKNTLSVRSDLSHLGASRGPWAGAGLDLALGEALSELW